MWSKQEALNRLEEVESELHEANEALERERASLFEADDKIFELEQELDTANVLIGSVHADALRLKKLLLRKNLYSDVLEELLQKLKNHVEYKGLSNYDD